MSLWVVLLCQGEDPLAEIASYGSLCLIISVDSYIMIHVYPLAMAVTLLRSHAMALTNSFFIVLYMFSLLLQSYDSLQSVCSAIDMLRRCALRCKDTTRR